MKRLAVFIWKKDDGVLSFEWILLITLLVIGIIGGICGARDAIIDEAGDAAQAMLALDQSYSISFPLEIELDGQSQGAGSDSSFTDAAAYFDCDRAVSPAGQGTLTDP